VLTAAHVPSSAAAQLNSNRYSIDLFTSPVLGPARIVGMGGAHLAIATGIDGATYNPVGYAERAEKEIDFFAFDITGGIWLGGLFRRNDFDNNGRAGLSSTDTVQLMLGTRYQFAQFGTGVTALARIYTLRDEAGRNSADLTLITVRAGAGYAFWDGGLVVGGGMVFTAFDLAPINSSRSLVAFRGYGAEVGALIRPKHKRYRIGTTFHTPISSRPRTDESMVGSDGIRRAEGLVVPESVDVPWDMGVGFAYQFGERRSNVPWRNTRELRREVRRQILSGSYQPPATQGEADFAVLPQDIEKAVDTAVENYRESQRRLRRNQPRRYMLLAADLLVYGKTPRGQSISAFLLQTPERSGAKISYSVRVGMESEVWQDRMKVRVGSYLEPSRVDRKFYRPHGTLGLEARLFDFWRWSARGTATIDVAPRYFNWGLAVGLWW